MPRFSLTKKARVNFNFWPRLSNPMLYLTHVTPREVTWDCIQFDTIEFKKIRIPCSCKIEVVFARL